MTEPINLRADQCADQDDARRIYRGDQWVQIEKAVDTYLLAAGTNEEPVLAIRLPLVGAAVDVRARVVLDEDTQRLLVGLGWQPPAVPDDEATLGRGDGARTHACDVAGAPGSVAATVFREARAARAAPISDLSATERARLGIVCNDDVEDDPERPDGEPTMWWDREGHELHGDDQVLVPYADLVELIERAARRVEVEAVPGAEHEANPRCATVADPIFGGVLTEWFTAAAGREREYRGDNADLYLSPGPGDEAYAAGMLAAALLGEYPPDYGLTARWGEADGD